MEYKPNQAALGLNLDNTALQIPQGQVSYALNAQVDNFDGQQLNYQNEQANEFCVDFPEGYKVIGHHNIIERSLTIFFLVNPDTGDSEIGKVATNSCTYEKIINAKCLNFNIDYPIHKAVHRTTSCGIEIFWTDNLNPRRFLDLDSLPFVQIENCPEPQYSDEIDCNKLLVQPNFNIPNLFPRTVDGDGTLKAGTYQFAIQYANDLSDGYTSYYSVTNPLPVYNENQTTLDFDYLVNKSITVEITNLDTSGYFEYFNLAVIKTVNNISTVDLVGTYYIDSDTKQIVYSGQGVQERLTINDIFEKFPIYNTADDLTTAQDVLIWSNLTTDERISYQKIANKINLKWQTWKIPGKEAYKNPLNSVYLRGYMRDEVYPAEIVFLLDNGKQTDGFHIPGRTSVASDLTPISNNDVIGNQTNECDPVPTSLPTWQVYNTANVIDYEQIYKDYTQGITYPCPKCPPVISTDPARVECYSGPFQYGEFAYWESTETYPCTDVWGELANKPIRHHKFPDSLITHIHDNEGAIYPIGFRVDIQQVLDLIRDSDLTEEQKSKIQGFKIVRGNRVNNKSVVAKGLIHNVGKYQRDEQVYLFPNYPYNDLNADPFISSSSNVSSTEWDPGTYETSICYSYTLENETVNNQQASYVDCNNQNQTALVLPGLTLIICSKTTPVTTGLTVTKGDVCGQQNTEPEDETYDPSYLNAFDEESKLRYTFHSPDTHFFQPTLGNILKLETAEFGQSKGHFKEVLGHSKYKFVSGNAYVTAISIGILIGFASNTIGVSTNAFNGTAAFTAYQAFIAIIDKVIPRRNFAVQYNSIGNYTDFRAVQNNGNKQRWLSISSYMAPGMMNVGDDHIVNNFQRESSVYLKTSKTLPYTHTIGGVPEDVSRWKLSDEGCNIQKQELKDISSYYASIKRKIDNQYGQIYSYETVDTGFQYIGGQPSQMERYQGVFGGDIFINQFAYKSKLPYFIDNRVSTGSRTYPDDSDIFYNELGNVGNPNYWFSTDANVSTYRALGVNLGPLFGIKAARFDCPENKFFYNDGKIYLFSYGIPYFYCESEVNVDMRQAFNSSEGDYFPRVSSDIPDFWLQETVTTIQQDNTYHYNKTYSKQNKENFFSHLPDDWEECDNDLKNVVIFSDPNNWFIYRGNSKKQLPLNFGNLVSIDGIENKQVLARFENKTLLYNALLTAPTSAAEVYLGQSLFSSQVPPLDFAETDTGYAGSQNKMFIKTEYGHISSDALRGQIFLFQGNGAKDMTEKNVTKFYNEHLNFYIRKQFPEYPIDNHFKGVGLHGVFDNKYNRLILTKLDYECTNKDVNYVDGKFWLNGEEIDLSSESFVNRSFTMSYDFDIQAWVSFHSYIPNFYVPQNNYFFSSKQNGLWKHNTCYTEFNKFYGQIEPYSVEFPYSFQANDQILQSIKDTSKVLTYIDNLTFAEVDDRFFNKLIVTANQQCSGLLLLTKKPKNNLKEASSYPKYNADSKEVLWTKSDNYYQINTFWDMVKLTSQPIWSKSDTNLSILKELNESNLDYSKRSFRKGPIRGKNIRVRYILDDRSDTKIVSQFNIISVQESFK